MNSTAPVFTWKRLLALGIIHVSTFALFTRITEDRMPLPVVGYAVLFILAVIGLVLTLAIASDLDQAADRERVDQVPHQRQPAKRAEGVLGPRGVGARHRLGGDVVGGNDSTGAEHLGGGGGLS